MKLLNNIFYFNLTKIFSFAYKLCSTDLLDSDFKKKLLEKINEVEHKQFMKEKPREEKNKKNLKDLLRKKFEIKNKIINEKINAYNIDIKNEENFMKSLNQKNLLEKHIIYNNYKCSENGDDYFSYGDLTKDGYIYCNYHGEPTQKIRKSKNFDK